MSELAPQPITYCQALADTADQRRHLLLGNGFSRALEERFNYQSLYSIAIREDPAVAFAFNRVGIHNGDFEAALSVADENDRKIIREGLIKAVAHVHPTLTKSQLAACGEFLRPFVGIERVSRGTLFTTNYDLFLYRAVIFNNAVLKCYDAFDSDGYWAPGRLPGHHLFHLHGGLYIYAQAIPALSGSTAAEKVRYRKIRAGPNEPLLPKIRAYLRQGHLPVFVTEGTPSEKIAAIRSHEYLRKVRRHFNKVCELPNTVLFTVGHSLHAVDGHIAQAIGSSGLRAVYVGCLGESDRVRACELTAEWVLARRAALLPPLEVFTFSTAECDIWGKQAQARAA